jgi:subtilisin family serine protease
MHARSVLAVLLLASPLAALGPAAGDAPPEAHVVIAVIDTGINPYHVEFRGTGPAMDPRAWVGYADDAAPLELCLGCATFSEAWTHDAALWGSVEAGRLYWFPGTRIVGAIRLAPDGDRFAEPTPVLDDLGHGTASASLAAGATLGACPSCWVVAVEGPGDAALAWALAQPWIDVVTNSWGLAANLDYPHGLGHDAGAGLTRALVEQGKTVLFSAGNGVEAAAAEPVPTVPEFLVPGESTYTSQYTGPDWVIAVGAVDPANGQPIAGSARPVDVVAAGLDVPAARSGSMTGTLRFTGTSASAPIAAGVFAQTLLEVRRALGDAAVGPRAAEVVASGPSVGAGPLSDGQLTRHELQRLVFGTARHCNAIDAVPCSAPDAWVMPRVPGWTAPTPAFAYPALVGYGIVDSASGSNAVAAALGSGAPPRPNVDRWAWADSLARQQLWGAWQPYGASVAELVG